MLSTSAQTRKRISRKNREHTIQRKCRELGYLREEFTLVKKIALATLAAFSLMVATPAMATDYLANPRSMKFHYSTCRTIKHPENFIPYSSREAAVNDGYAACKICRP